jgi:hypothetical protein
MRKHHNKLFYGKYRYKLAFDMPWAPMLNPTTDENLQSFIDGKQTQTKYLNRKFWSTTSEVVALAKFIKEKRSDMKFRLQSNKSLFYTDKGLANELVGTFWERWIDSRIVDPQHGQLEKNIIGCRKIPHGKYRYQVFLKKKKSLAVKDDKRQALLKFLDTNSDNVLVPNLQLIDWLEGKDKWYPSGYFYITEEKYLTPLYVLAGDLIEKIQQYKETMNAGN